MNIELKYLNLNAERLVNWKKWCWKRSVSGEEVGAERAEKRVIGRGAERKRRGYRNGSERTCSETDRQS